MTVAWGEDITILCVSDAIYLPGVYGLFNSAILNGFKGRFTIVQVGHFEENTVFKHDQLDVRPFPTGMESYHLNVARFSLFPTLSPGNYLFLDADIIVERPLKFLTEMLETSVLVSKETEPKYDTFDIMFQRQAKKVGYDPFFMVKNIGYINGGLLGFSIPQHSEFLQQLAEKCQHYLSGILTYCTNPDWYFIDQDMLNVVIRGSGVPVSVISPRLLEIGNYPSKDFYRRPFPASKQTNLSPKDQLKYIIHGAALRRPWMNPYPATWIGKVKKQMYDWGFQAWKTSPTPYERAWAYYACREDLPVPISFWASKHGFKAYRNSIWKKYHGI
jgi:hypothetical protein